MGATEEVKGFVKLISSDDHEFFVDEKILNQCDVLARMVSQTNFIEGQTRTIKLKEVSIVVVLAKLITLVLTYMYGSFFVIFLCLVFYIIYLKLGYEKDRFIIYAFHPYSLSFVELVFFLLTKLY